MSWRPRRDAASSPATRSRTTLPAAAPAWRSTSTRSSPASGIRRAPTRTSSTTRPRCARSGSASARSPSSTDSDRTSRSPSLSSHSFDRVRLASAARSWHRAPARPRSPDEGELARARSVDGTVIAATRGEPDFSGKPPDTRLDLADVIASRVGRAVVKALVLGDELREFRPEELEERLARPGPEEQHVRLGDLRTGLTRPDEERAQIGLAVRQTRKNRHDEEASEYPAGGERPHRLEAQIGPGRPGLEAPTERAVQRRDAEVHPDLRACRDLLEQRQIATHERRFRRDGQAHAGYLHGPLEHPPGDLELRLRGLIGICRGPERHKQPAASGALELRDERARVGQLDVDASLEGFGFVMSEELVGVAGEAVPAGHLAPAGGIGGPAERHWPGIQTIHEARRSKVTIFNAAALVERRPHPGPHSPRPDSRLDLHCRHLLSSISQEKTRGPEDVPGSIPSGASLHRPRAHRPDAGPGHREAHRSRAAAEAELHRRRDSGP